MKAPKLFGICIVFLIAAASVNAVTLDELLNHYSSSYSDGTFNVQYTGYSGINASFGNAGKEYLKFNISGSGVSANPYTIVAVTDSRGASGYLYGGNYLSQINKSTGQKSANLTIDGKYFYCNITQPYNTLSTDFKIYQNGILHYENKFNQQTVCQTDPVKLWDLDNAIRPVDTNSDGKYDRVDLYTSVYLPETRNYTIGAYIWDGKSATAYSETQISGTVGVYDPITISFNSSVTKEFDLKNSSILLKSISIDGHIMDYNETEYRFDHGSGTCPRDPIRGFNTCGGASINVSNSNFSFGDFYIKSYSFNKTLSTGKIKQFGVSLKSANFNGPYKAEVSLENVYGESVGVNKTTINSQSSTIWFNGTDVYNNKVSGPYRIGSIRITKNNNEVFYQVNKGTSQDFTYFNFTAPPMSDLKINNSDLKGNNKDLNVTVFNQGTGDASGIIVTVFNSQAQKIKEVILSNINSGNNQMYKFTGINLTSGFVAVDFNNEIEELNESNNIASFSFIPPGPNNKPAITTTPSSTATRGQTYSYDVNATDADVGDVLTYSTNSTFGSINPSNGLFTWNILNTDFGTRNIRFSVSDGKFIRNQSIVISLNSNNYTLRAGTLDYTSELFINSTINVASQTKNATSMINFTVNGNTPLTITHSAVNHLTDSDYIYVDSRLSSCVSGSNCTFTGTYTTICGWQPTSNKIIPLANSWYCSVEGGSLPQKDWFRYTQSPEHYIRRFNYLK